MSKHTSTVRKRERERMKVEKAAMKRERRDQRKSERLKAYAEHGVEGTAPVVEAASDPEAADRQAQGSTEPSPPSP